MAIGYSHTSGVPYQRAITKYTPTWPRSFTPSQQATRELVAKMKIIHNYSILRGKSIGNAFFKEFLKERAHEIDRVERTRIQQQIEERRFTPPEGYTSFSWYQELKRRAAQGDTEAAAQLEKPFTNP